MRLLKINTSGAITIPKAYRKKYKEVIGFTYKEKGGTITLKPVKEES